MSTPTPALGFHMPGVALRGGGTAAELSRGLVMRSVDPGDGNRPTFPLELRQGQMVP
jgi:hypothetical protein